MQSNLWSSSWYTFCCALCLLRTGKGRGGGELGAVVVVVGWVGVGGRCGGMVIVVVCVHVVVG